MRTNVEEIEARKVRKELVHHNWIPLVIDITLCTVASLTGIILVRLATEPIYGFQGHVLLWAAISAVATTLAILLRGTQHIVFRYATMKSVGLLAEVVALKELILALSILVGLFEFRSVSTEVLLVAFDAFASLSLMVTARIIILALNDSANDNPDLNIDRKGILVYGTGYKSVGLLTRLKASPEYNVLGFISATKEHSGQIIQDLKVITFNNEEDVRELKRQIGLAGILFPPDAEDDERSDKLIMYCLHCGIHVLMAPSIDDLSVTSLSPDRFAPAPGAGDEFIPDGMSGFERSLKRCVDCVMAGILLIIFAPAFAICAIAIKLEDGGPAIYKQERIGKYGKPFNILKFRSMRTDAEKMGPALYSGQKDPRLTKVGAFLRDHHLDELPQLWNVFIGEMAFIGYRPERRYYINQIIQKDPRYFYLYQIRPGVTSYSTLMNGYTDTVDKMVIRLEYDLYYLRHRSWLFDIKVLWNTFTNIVFGKIF